MLLHFLIRMRIKSYLTITTICFYNIFEYLFIICYIIFAYLFTICYNKFAYLLSTIILKTQNKKGMDKRMKRRVISLLIVTSMILIMSGCGAKETKNAAEIFTEAQEKMLNAKSVDGKVKMVISMESGEKKMDMNMDMVMSVFTDPYKGKINIKRDMGKLGVTDSEMYMVSEDDKFYTYIGMNGKWAKQEVEQSLFEQTMKAYNSSAYMDAFLESADNFTKEEIEEDGKKLYKLQGEVSGESLEKIMKSLQGMNQLELFKNKSALADIGSFSITAYVDKESHTIDRLSMDMTDMMKKMMESIIKAAGSTQTVTVNTCTMDIEYTSINSSEDFEIPEEAKNAAEIDTSKK